MERTPEKNLDRRTERDTEMLRGQRMDTRKRAVEPEADPARRTERNKPEPQAEAKKGLLAKKGGLIAGAIAALIGGFLLFGGPSNDDLTREQIQERTQQFEQAVAAGRMVFPVYDLSDKAQVTAATDAIKAMAIAPEEQKAMVARVQTEAAKAPAQRTTEFFVLQLEDNCVVDGDIVAVQSNGFPSTTVTLAKNAKTIVIPKTPGQPLTVTVVGVHDGGGGITVGASTSTGPIALPVLRPGETVPLTVR